MITIDRPTVRPIKESSLLIEDTAKGFVPQHELWYGYPKEQFQEGGFKRAFAELQVGSEVIRTKIVYNGKYILCGDLCTLNDIVAACDGTDFMVPEVEKMGYLDEVSRRKYYSTPINGFWDLLGNPILIRK